MTHVLSVEPSLCPTNEVKARGVHLSVVFGDAAA